MSKLNAAILIKNILGVSNRALLTERNFIQSRAKALPAKRSKKGYGDENGRICDCRCFFYLSGLIYRINSATDGDFSGTVISYAFGFGSDL